MDKHGGRVYQGGGAEMMSIKCTFMQSLRELVSSAIIVLEQVLHEECIAEAQGDNSRFSKTMGRDTTQSNV
jgi:hypothetical protein